MISLIVSSVFLFGLLHRHELSFTTRDCLRVENGCYHRLAAVGEMSRQPVWEVGWALFGPTPGMVDLGHNVSQLAVRKLAFETVHWHWECKSMRRGFDTAGQNRSSRTKDTVFFIPHLLPCQNQMPTLLTEQVAH